MIITRDKKLMSTGYNGTGQLGLGDTDDRSSYSIVEGVDNVKYVSTGRYHSAILLEDGTLMTTGKNSTGSLGLMSTAQKAVFTPVPNITGIRQVSCGEDFTFILLEDGTIMGTGSNIYGQLGIGNTTNQLRFTLVSGIPKVSYISCGAFYTMIVLEDGRLMTTGRNNYGQGGYPVSGVNYVTSFREVTGIPGKVKRVFCGLDFTYILLEDGTLMSTGYNNTGQLGLGDMTNRSAFTKVNFEHDIKEVDCGNNFAIITGTDGKVYGTGSSGNYQLGKAGGASLFNDLGLSNIKIARTGYLYSVFLTEDREVMAIGYNQFGQIGNGQSGNTVQTFYRTGVYAESLFNDFVIDLIVFQVDSQSLLLSNELDFSISIIESSQPVSEITVYDKNDQIIHSVSDLPREAPFTINFSIGGNDFQEIFQELKIVINNTGIEESKIVSLYLENGKIMQYRGKAVVKTPVEGYSEALIETKHDGDLITIVDSGSGWQIQSEDEVYLLEEGAAELSIGFLGGEKTELKAYGIGWR
jgi:alpha-tubulin suppressor-like RCC1 family protein